MDFLYYVSFMFIYKEYVTWKTPLVALLIFCSHTMSVVGFGHALADRRSTRILSPAAGRSDDYHSVQSGKDVYPTKCTQMLHGAGICYLKLSICSILLHIWAKCRSIFQHHRAGLVDSLGQGCTGFSPLGTPNAGQQATGRITSLKKAWFSQVFQTVSLVSCISLVSLVQIVHVSSHSMIPIYSHIYIYISVVNN